MEGKNKRKDEKIGYCTYGFMTELGLTKSEISVYAFIYAYRKSEYGIYFGRRDYIAKECGISIRTVERAMPKLRRLGLIEKRVVMGMRGYACTPHEEGDITETGAHKRERAASCELEAEEPQLTVRQIIGGAPKYRPIDVGVGYFSMTREQINALLSLISEDELRVYIRKMELMLEKNMKSGKPPPKSYYRTIRKWITESYSV